MLSIFENLLWCDFYVSRRGDAVSSDIVPRGTFREIRLFLYAEPKHEEAHDINPRLRDTSIMPSNKFEQHMLF
jgi:hypothetical protein